MADADKTILFGEGDKPTGLKPPYVVIVDGPHTGARFPLKEGINIIGRLDECHVVLDDQSVSRKHLELNLEAQGWTVNDLQSKNGSFVNGALVEGSVVIGHKDLVRVGIYTIRLITQEIDQAEEMEVPSQDVGEFGTMMVGERPVSGETARLGAPGKPQPTREVTSPHSPLEEEEMSKVTGFPKVRTWVLYGTLFVVVLAAGLYFYWQTVLAPGTKEEKKPKETPVATKPIEPQTIPLGPPEPVKPQTVPVFLDCVANPFPATVRFSAEGGEAKEIGKTPLKVNVDLVPNQSYDIEAQFEMPEIQETYTSKLQFQVSPDQSTLPLLFRAPLGTIKVTSLPRDAALYLEAYFDYNRFQGKPIKLQNLVLNKPIYAPFGRYIVELRQLKQMGDAASAIEDIVFHREFVLKEDQPTYVLEVTEEGLQQLPAEIRSIPAGADLFVDQKKIGQTPFVGTIPVGKHTLTVRKDGYFESTEEFTADVNTPFKKEIVLKTSPAGEKINQAKANLNQELYQEAVQALSDSFTLNPTERETAEARYLLGNVYLTLKDFQKAYGYYDQAKSHDDFKYWAKLGMANVLSEQKMATQALVPLVEVFLNAKEEAVLREGHNILRKISPLRSVVYIQSEPAGAILYLNDKKLEQTTPILLHEMGLGSYRVRLEKVGFQPLDLTLNLTVNEFNPVLAKLKPIPQ